MNKMDFVDSSIFNHALLQQVDIHALNAQRVVANTIDLHQLVENSKQEYFRLCDLYELNKSDINIISDVLSAIENGDINKDKLLKALTQTHITKDTTVFSLQNQCALESGELISQLLDNDEIVELRAYLDRSLFTRLKWCKGDYIIVYLASFVCLLLECVNMAWRMNSPIDKGNVLADWFDNKFHNHPANNPIDYQGPHFGGGNHRGRTSGHDIARFFEAVQQTMNGEFHGVYWRDKTPLEVFSQLNQYGNPYPKMSLLAAIGNVFLHLIGDFFSKYSLQIPFSSYIMENGGREYRKFVMDLYENGFNLRQISINGLQIGISLIAVKVWLWFQFGKEKGEAIKLKEYEMRLAITSILSGANIAGCTLFQNPYMINIPALISVVDNAVHVYNLNSMRNSKILKQARNIDDLISSWSASLR